MDPLTGASAFATIIGLICNWKQERASLAQDRYQDFMVWLESHNFQNLRLQISESSELQSGLHDLLRSDIADIAEKLEIVTDAISSVSKHVKNLSKIDEAFQNPAALLSEQACFILENFANDHNAESLVVQSIGMRGATILDFSLMPSGTSFRVKEQRFAEDDLQSLAKFGYIKFSGTSKNGSPIYNLTRSGSSFANNLVKSSEASK